MFGEYAYRDYFSICTVPLSEPINIDQHIDYIIHATSLASSQHYTVRPIEVMMPNTSGSYHLLNLVVEKKVKTFLLFSTGDIYSVVKDRKTITESDYGSMDTLDIHNCYSESKRMAETMCKAFLQQHDVPVKIAPIWHTHATTMYIENDPRVFASFVKNVVERQDIVIKSEGLAKRSFCYITDAVICYYKILLSGVAGEAYNVCNSNEWYSIAELAELLMGLYPEYGLQMIKQRRDKNEQYVENTVASFIPPNNSNLKKLGWNATISAKEGFRSVIDGILI